MTLVRNLNTKSQVYSEFLTNAAVAWFSAGVIAPLFTKALGAKELLASIISIIACLAFLRLATVFGKEER